MFAFILLYYVYILITYYPEYIAQSYTSNPQTPNFMRVTKNLSLNLEAPPGVYKIDFSRLYDILPAKKPTNNKEKYQCSAGFILGYSYKNQFFKALVCGREWCKICGQDYSISHQRRIARLTPYARTLKTAGYIVVTIPKAARGDFESKENLNLLRDYWRRKFKREGIERGIFRYHYAGDDGQIYKPHLNILIPRAWIKPQILDKWKQEFETWFFETFKIKGAGNIYYNYTRNPAKIHHLVKYITRATYKGNNDEIHAVIRNYKNTIRFGTWTKIVDETNDPEQILNNNIDRECNSPIEWIGQIFKTDEINPLLINKKFKYLEAGIYRRQIPEQIGRSLPNMEQHLNQLNLDYCHAMQIQKSDLTKKGRERTANIKRTFYKLSRLDEWNQFYSSLPPDEIRTFDQDAENIEPIIKQNLEAYKSFNAWTN